MATQNYFKVKNGLEFPSIETLQTTDNTGPSIKPSLNLDFAKTKSLDPRITFTRASTATYYDGETTAKAEENLFTSSQDITGTGWNTLNIQTRTSNAITAPDGTLTGCKFTSTTTDARHLLVNYISGVTAGTTYTFSAYFKAAEYTNIALGFENATSGVKKSAILDLTTGVIKSLYDDNSSATFSNFSYSAVSVGNGWYRASVTATATLSMSFITAQFTASPSFSPALAVGMPSYAGDSTSGLYIWGAQAEARAYATAYTPTTASPITNYIPVLQTAATNAARFDHDPVTGESKGLLIEEQRTNQWTFSEDFVNTVPSSNFASLSVRSKSGIAPNGTLSADLIVPSTANDQHYLIKGITTSGTQTLSFYAKAGGYYWIGASSRGSSINMFNLSTGQLGTVAANCNNTITHVGNGWYRCTVTNSNPTGLNEYVFVENTNGQVGWSGDGYSGIYVWGFQLETGSFATSYIPTALTYTGRGSTATYKAADGLIRTAAANVARYNANESGGGNLLLESAATNLYQRSSNFSDSYWTKSASVLTENAILAPDGTFSGAKLTETTINNQHRITTVNIQAGTLTVSVYAKAGERSKFEIVTPPIDMGYDLINGTVINVGYGTSGATIVPLGNGWYRCSLTYTTDASHGNGFGILNNSNVRTYAGDGVSGIYLWGAQIETGSVATSYIPSTETHTGRSSTATYYDSTGTIRTAASGQPRYTYNPDNLSAAPKLLLEAAATNQQYNSEDFNAASNQSGYNTTITVNATTAPDGNMTADRLNGSTTAGTFNYLSKYCANGTTGTRQTSSVYAKAGSEANLWMSINNSGGAINEPNAVFNLSVGSFSITSTSGYGTAAGMQYVGNGWYRCWISHTIDGSPTSGQWATTFSSGSARNSQGNLYLWGCQVEYATYVPTSYIPTTSAAVTRAADTSTSVAGSRAADVYSSSQVTRSGDFTSIIGSNYTTWFRNDEGTFYTDTTSFGLGSAATRVIEASNGAANTISLMYTSAGAYSYNNDVNSIGVSNGVSIAGKAVYALAYKTNDAALCTNGGSVSTDTSVQIPNGLSRLDIGYSTYYTPRQLNGYFKKLAFYPKRLSNAELVSITS